MLATFAKWWGRVQTKLFDTVWDGEDKNFETEGAIAVVEKAEARRLPFDDVEEWLAARLREFDHQLVRIEVETGAEIGLRNFIQRSLRNPWYRRALQADTPTAYTLKHVKNLKELLAIPAVSPH